MTQILTEFSIHNTTSRVIHHRKCLTSNDFEIREQGVNKDLVGDQLSSVRDPPPKNPFLKLKKSKGHPNLVIY